MKIKTAADSIDPQLKRRGVEVKKEKTDQTVFGSNWNLLLPEKASSHWLNDILLHNFDQNNTRVHTGNIRVSIRMLLVCCPYVFVCYSFVTRMYPGGVSVRKDRKSLKENQGEKRQSTHHLLFLPFLRGWRMILTRNNKSKLSLSGGSQRRTTALSKSWCPQHFLSEGEKFWLRMCECGRLWKIFQTLLLAQEMRYSIVIMSKSTVYAVKVPF